MTTVARRPTLHAVARPLKTLVPLIKTELTAGDRAGLDHYRRAGDLLIEAKDSGQVSHGSWGRWLSTNFSLSQRTAQEYMQLARQLEKRGEAAFLGQSKTTIIGTTERKQKRRAKFRRFEAAVDGVDVESVAQARQTREDEITLHRDLALELIDIGYKALATRLHPDRGGSRDAMARLNRVRDELKDVAKTRRFV